MRLPSHKTKLVCTIGPASDTTEMMVRIMKAGMDVASLNFSHGDFTGHKVVIEKLRAASSELLLDETDDDPLGAASRIAKAAEAEGKRGEQNSLPERTPQTQPAEQDRSDRSSENGRGRILDLSA